MSTQAMTQQIAEYFKTQPVLKAQIERYLTETDWEKWENK